MTNTYITILLIISTTFVILQTNAAFFDMINNELKEYSNEDNEDFIEIPLVPIPGSEGKKRRK